MPGSRSSSPRAGSGRPSGSPRSTHAPTQERPRRRSRTCSMSSDRRSDAPSPRPDELGPLVRSRGAPLLEALTEHVPDAEEHADATASYAFIAAVELGFGRERCELYRDVTRLHEIGVVYVPAEIASKPASARTAAEAATFEGHYEAGYRLARGAGVPERVCGWLLRQRERFDGSGPEGLAGERVS